MKSSSILFASLAAAFACAAFNAYATPRASIASGSNFLVAADDLDGWHLGGFYRYQSREIADGFDNLSQDNFGVTIGRDIFSCLSVYGFAGTTDSQLDNASTESDLTAQFGFGVWCNIIDQDLINDLSIETKIRVQAMAQMSFYSPELNGDEVSLHDTYAALTISLVNELIGNKSIWPDAIGLFFGPVYSELGGDDIDATGDNVGLTVGLDLFVTHNVGLSAAYETYGDDNAVVFSLDCRF